MKKVIYWILIILLQSACHQYDDDAHAEGDLPSKLIVDVIQMDFDVRGSSGSVRVLFEYQGSLYSLRWDKQDRYSQFANAICTQKEEFAITSPPEETASELWKDEITSETTQWGITFIAVSFEPFLVGFKSIPLINPGNKVAREKLMGINEIVISLRPENTKINFSRWDISFIATDPEYFNSQAYAGYYLDHPEQVIDIIRVILNSRLQSDYFNVEIYKTSL